MLATILEFLADESGATAIEYALVAGMVSIASVAAWGSLGGSVNAAFGSVSSDVGTVASSIEPGSRDFATLSADTATLEGASQ